MVRTGTAFQTGSGARKRAVFIPQGAGADSSNAQSGHKTANIYLIYTSDPIYLEQLTECVEVSRNTIFTDLKEAAQLLEQCDLTLDYQPKQGYSVNGDVVRIRALFILYFNELSGLFNSGIIKFYHPDQIKEYLERLKQIEAELGINYVAGVLPSIAALLPLLYQHRRPITFTGLKQAEIEKTNEYALCRKYFPDLNPEEQLYLSLHLLGSRVNLVPDEFFESKSQNDVYDLTAALISEFEKTACVKFDNPRELERALFIHLNTSLYRYRFGIQIGNILGDQLRILIVCVNGLSTGNMIKREVQKLLPFVKIVGVVAAIGLTNAQDICDLIISTVKVSSIVPSITIHPVLTEFDRRSILTHRLVAPRNVALQRKQIFQVVRPYVKPEDFLNQFL